MLSVNDSTSGSREDYINFEFTSRSFKLKSDIPVRL